MTTRLNEMNRQDVTEAVAQAWCTDENAHKEMDSTLATTIIDNVMQRITGEAFGIIKQAMIDDEPSKQGSYAHSWHCNIAMMCYDAIHAAGVVGEGLLSEDAPHKIGNDAASRFMKLCFDVETKG